MKYHFTHKLKSRAGETLSETLVAVLISALALTMLAGAITSSANAVEKSRKKLDTYYSANEELIAGGVEGGSQADGAESAVSSGTLTVTVSSTDTGINITESETVPYVQNEVFGKTPVILYETDSDTEEEDDGDEG